MPVSTENLGETRSFEDLRPSGTHSGTGADALPRLRILVISNLYPPFHRGGYGLHCQWYSEALARRGHTVQVLTSRPEPSWQPDGSEGELSVVRELLWVEGSRILDIFRRTVKNSSAVTRAIRNFCPDVIYCHGIDGVGFQVYHTATMSGIPSLSTIGDTWLSQAWRDLGRFDIWSAVATARSGSGLKKLAKKGAGFLGRSLGLIVRTRPCGFGPCVLISTYLVDDLRASGAPIDRRVTVTPPMLPEHFFTSEGESIGRAGTRGDHLRALYVSRFEMLKGPDTALAGVAKAIGAGANVTLTLAGLDPNNLKSSLMKMSQRLGIESRTIWAGTPTASELVSLYRQHDVFLFPSQVIEGFGVVNAEAMACGLPVIGVATSGAADIIRDGETGFRIAPGDSDAIARHLLRLYRDPALTEFLSRNATAITRRHHPSRVIDKIEQCLYQAVRIHENPSLSLGLP